nr:archaemetzincin [Chryseolinea lacunae]
MLPTKSDDNIPATAQRQLYGGRRQLLTTYLLDILQDNIPDDAIVVMAITSADLYPSNDFNFVFGQARLKKRVGVSSIYRLESEDPHVGLMRLIKTGSHEIAHMFSCQHCTYARCVMNGSNSLPESDFRPNRLCYDCHRKLFWNLGFDVKRRVANLNNFFVRHELKSDYDVASRDSKALGF